MTIGTASVGPSGAIVAQGDAPSGRRLDKVRFQWSTPLLLLPAAILIAGVFLYGVAYSIYLGFTNLSLLGPTAQDYQWTGMANIDRMLHDPVFYKSLWLTALFVGSGVVGGTFFGLAIAVLMRRTLMGLRFLAGGAAMIAFMLPPVTIAILWYAASVSGGTFAVLTGNSAAQPLFAAPLLFTSIANMWSLTGLTMLLFGAALRNIPADLDEAASLEGAGPARRFFSLTLPLLKPTIVTSALLLTILSLANFAIIWLMTQGGPQDATMILPVYSYQQGFGFNNLAYGALLGNVMILLSALLGFAIVRATVGRTRRKRKAIA
jgi:multiple sugar transport system permease protein